MVFRKVDQLGRIVLPSSMRKRLDIHHGSTVFVSMNEDGKITVGTVQERCAVCGIAPHDGIKTISLTANSCKKIICCHCALKVAQRLGDDPCDN